MKGELVFCGYSNFNSKDGTKHYYVLNFFTYPSVSDDKALSEPVNLFVTEDKYSDFIKSNDLLSVVEIPFEIIGNKVRYYL